MSIPTIYSDPRFVRSKIISLDLYNIRSSYPQENPWEERNFVGMYEHTDWALEGMADALAVCQDLVSEEGGELSVTEAGRKFSVSAKARAKFLRGEKHAYVAPAGGSMHNAGAAVDWWVYKLNFRGIPRDKWLGHLWEIVIPQGFTPIIKQPSLKASECWHFDYRGPWQDTYDWFKRNYPGIAYDQMARCVILDAGAWDLKFDTKRKPAWVEWAFLQAQLHRIGVHEVGKVDGIFGVNSKAAVDVAVEMLMAGAGPGPHFGARNDIAEWIKTVPDNAVTHLRQNKILAA